MNVRKPNNLYNNALKTHNTEIPKVAKEHGSVTFNEQTGEISDPNGTVVKATLMRSATTILCKRRTSRTPTITAPKWWAKFAGYYPLESLTHKPFDHHRAGISGQDGVGMLASNNTVQSQYQNGVTDSSSFIPHAADTRSQAGVLPLTSNTFFESDYDYPQPQMQHRFNYHGA
ncbi:hypothetical protein QBC45DRAFT_392068 [Copromyces sp. CBS 386.78]|nr:hypothetical protein QBC45DRAFT_392068 [Copromyces sp. CBS 386.78]